MRKRIISSLFAMAVLVSVLSGSYLTASATGTTKVEPRYTGISNLTTSLSISANGGASCSGSVIARSGYTTDVTVELKQDGTTIKTWTASGSGAVSAGGTYFVMSGHDYVVTTTADVYKNGTLIESPSKDSPSKSY